MWSLIPKFFFGIYLTVCTVKEEVIIIIIVVIIEIEAVHWL